MEIALSKKMEVLLSYLETRKPTVCLSHKPECVLGILRGVTLRNVVTIRFENQSRCEMFPNDFLKFS